jgi:TetR/AcrR family transcriptional regulator
LPQLRSERGTPLVTPEKAPLSRAGRIGASKASYDKLKPGPGRPAAEVARHQRARIHSAMVEAVAERGYDAVTVRGLARAAGVSTRTFYQHYPSKEDCFWSVHQLIVRRVLRSLGAAQAGIPSQEERVRRAIQAIVREWDANPKAARLMLIDAYVAGTEAPRRTRRAIRSIEARLSEGLDGGAGASMSIITEGVLAGIIRVARSRLLRGQGDSLAELGNGLARWALSCQSPIAVDLPETDLSSGRYSAERSRPVPSSRREEEGASEPCGDVSLLLSAVSKLVAAGNTENFSLDKIFATAGISRRSFYDNFSQAEDCLIAAMELHAREAMVRTRQAGKSGHTPAENICHTVSALSLQVARDAAFARLCFGEMTDAGMPMMQCRDRFMAEIDELIAERMPPICSADELAIEASVGALWGTLQNEVSLGRASRAPRIAGMLAYLTLAPIVGAPAALDAIRLASTTG